MDVIADSLANFRQPKTKFLGAISKSQVYESKIAPIAVKEKYFQIGKIKMSFCERVWLFWKSKKIVQRKKAFI